MEDKVYYKRGKYSDNEMELIKNSDKSDEEIAKELNRPVESIKKIRKGEVKSTKTSKPKKEKVISTCKDSENYINNFLGLHHRFDYNLSNKEIDIKKKDDFVINLYSTAGIKRCMFKSSQYEEITELKKTTSEKDIMSYLEKNINFVRDKKNNIIGADKDILIYNDNFDISLLFRFTNFCSKYNINLNIAQYNNDKRKYNIYTAIGESNSITEDENDLSKYFKYYSGDSLFKVRDLALKENRINHIILHNLTPTQFKSAESVFGIDIIINSEINIILTNSKENLLSIIDIIFKNIYSESTEIRFITYSGSVINDVFKLSECIFTGGNK